MYFSNNCLLSWLNPTSAGSSLVLMLTDISSFPMVVRTDVYSVPRGIVTATRIEMIYLRLPEAKSPPPSGVCSLYTAARVTHRKYYYDRLD